LNEKTARSLLLWMRLPSKRLISYACDLMQRDNIHVLLEHRMHFFSWRDPVGTWGEGIKDDRFEKAG